MAGTVIPWTMRPRATTMTTATKRNPFSITRRIALRTSPNNPPRVAPDRAARKQRRHTLTLISPARAPM